MLRRLLYPLLAVAVLAAPACGDDGEKTTPDTTSPDAIGDVLFPDTVVPDTVTPDTVTPDTATPDTLTPDTETPDTAIVDTETPDTAVADTAVADTAVADTAVADTAVADTAVADTAVADTAVADTVQTSACASDLFFSEYLEGSSNNKVLEIANFTGAPVNLGDYAIASLGNIDGVVTWDANGSAVALPWHVLPSGEVYVICNSGLAEEMKASCDAIVGANIGPFEATPIYFNGNDARALVKAGVRIDTIGTDTVLTEGGGWTVDGVSAATLDHTLVRRPAVKAPNADWAAAAAAEWEVRAKDDASDLGLHTFGYTCAATSAAADVVLNEIVAAPVGAGVDWIELYNNEATAVDLGGWTINDTGSATSGETFTFAAGTMIPAGGFLVILRDTNFTFGLGGADALSLKDAAGVFADLIQWKEGEAPEGKSFGRVPDGTGPARKLESPTPAAANDTTVCGNSVCEAAESCGSCAADCGACPAVKLNEVLYASADASPAFVELYNADAAEADLSGWSLLADSGDEYVFPDNTVIAAGAYLVLDAATTGLTLLDTDGLGLVDPGSVELQGTTWSALAAGESWGRVPNVTGPFAKLAAPSPGAENVGAGTGGGCASDLFFSEYVEGSSNNKALEIANFTGAAVDLAGYEIWLATNGAAFSATPQALTGTLAHGDVFLICHSSFAAALFATSNCDLVVSSQVITFNGDDARGLAKKDAGGGASTLIDVIGLTDAVDPGNGWEVATVAEGTYNHTLRRKLNVVAPSSVWATAQASEWEVLPQDTVDGLGSHAYGGTCP